MSYTVIHLKMYGERLTKQSRDQTAVLLLKQTFNNNVHTKPNMNNNMNVCIMPNCFDYILIIRLIRM